MEHRASGLICAEDSLSICIESQSTLIRGHQWTVNPNSFGIITWCFHVIYDELHRHLEYSCMEIASKVSQVDRGTLNISVTLFSLVPEIFAAGILK